MSNSGIEKRADPKVLQVVGNIKRRFLERIAYRLQNGLSEQELAEELTIEALALTDASYGFVLRVNDDQLLMLDAVVSVDSDGTMRPLQDTFLNQQPDELMQDVMITLKPVFSNNAAEKLTANLPDSHPTVNSYAICPLTEGSRVKGLLFVANVRGRFDIHLLARLQSAMDALIQVHINKVIHRDIEPLAYPADPVRQQLVNLLEVSFNCVIMLDENFRISMFNRASEHIFDIQSNEAIGHLIDEFIDQGTIHDLLEQWKATDTSFGQSLQRELESVGASSANGRQFTVRMSAFFTVDNEKRVYTLVLQERDEPDNADTNVPSDLLNHHALKSLIPVGVLKLNRSWLCEFANEAWCELTGREVGRNLESGWLAALHPDDQPYILMHMRYALHKGRKFREIMRLKNAKGEFVKTSFNATSLEDDNNDPSGYLVVVMNLTDQQQAEQQLKRLAHHDPLTGLPNRTQFLEHLENALLKRQSDDVVALLFIDLDGFKAINDTLGHDAGDELLQQVARRLKHTVREADTIARLGGDEFSVTLGMLEFGKDASIVAEAIVDAIKQPFVLKQEEVYVSASVGIALSQGLTLEKPNINSLIKQADVALYRAKLSGRSRYVFFTAELDQAQRDRSLLITSLRRAVDRQDFELYYQPQLLIRDQQLLGFEALLRWPQALGNHISPADFIDVLEDIGLIGELGEWAIGQACSQHRIWLERGLIGPATTMSVNVSARQLGMPRFAASVAAILQNQGMRPDNLILEITESALVQTFETNIINDIRNLGVQISLDDFGTGYSSLAYLSQLPVDHLKIDRSFIADIERFPHAVTVIKSIIALASTLGIRVIAEGVEDGDVLPLLEQEGCEGYQGYFFSKPLPAEDMTRKLREIDTVRLNHYANFINLDATLAPAT
ncbi:MAG: EAL domain-containing protein [Granulosicoccus sp.]